MLSDSDLGKKMGEEEDVYLFTTEYEAVTGRALEIVSPYERPDFLCSRGREPRLGLEIVRVMEDPLYRRDQELLYGEAEVDPVGTAIALQEAIYHKDKKRASAGWRCPGRTILVVQLMDAPIEDVARYLDNQILDELHDTGFLEIWVADHTVVDPYGTVQLMGIKPRRWRGVHKHRFHGTKPYG